MSISTHLILWQHHTQTCWRDSMHNLLVFEFQSKAIYQKAVKSFFFPKFSGGQEIDFESSGYKEIEDENPLIVHVGKGMKLWHFHQLLNLFPQIWKTVKKRPIHNLIAQNQLIKVAFMWLGKGENWKELFMGCFFFLYSAIL